MTSWGRIWGLPSLVSVAAMNTPYSALLLSGACLTQSLSYCSWGYTTLLKKGPHFLGVLSAP